MGNDPRSGGQGNPGQGNPGQGNPGQGNPGQGNPGQGNPVRAILVRAIPDKAIPVRATPVKAILVKVVLGREILAKENQTKAAAKAAAKVAKVVVPAVARVVKAAARVVNFDQCPLSRRGHTLGYSLRRRRLERSQEAEFLEELHTPNRRSLRRAPILDSPGTSGVVCPSGCDWESHMPRARCQLSAVGSVSTVETARETSERLPSGLLTRYWRFRRAPFAMRIRG